MYLFLSIITDLPYWPLLSRLSNLSSYISSTQDNIYNKKRYKYQYFHRILSKYYILVHIFLMKTSNRMIHTLDFLVSVWIKKNVFTQIVDVYFSLRCSPSCCVVGWYSFAFGRDTPAWNIIGYSAQKRCRYLFLLFFFTPAV